MKGMDVCLGAESIAGNDGNDCSFNLFCSYCSRSHITFYFLQSYFHSFMFSPWPLALDTLGKETRALVSALQVLLAVLDGKARSPNSSFGTRYTRWIQLCSQLYKIPKPECVTVLCYLL